MAQFVLCFFFNDTATTEIYTLSLHDALPIFVLRVRPDLDHRGRGARPLDRVRLFRNFHYWHYGHYEHRGRRARRAPVSRKAPGDRTIGPEQGEAPGGPAIPARGRLVPSSFRASLGSPRGP